MSIYLGYATFKNAHNAQKICKTLLTHNLIACANIFPAHTSLYEWKGKPVTTKEVAVIFKTQKKHTKAVIKIIQSLHSYEVPCIVFWPVAEGSKQFLNWVKTQTETQHG
jgi:periplasmic divalent cation tolerance protein